MLLRFPVRAIADRFLGPLPSAVSVDVVSMTRVDANKEATMVWIAKSELACNPARGYPLEPGTKVEVDLLPGESLWAITQGDGLLGISVKGYRGA